MSGIEVRTIGCTLTLQCAVHDAVDGTVQKPPPTNTRRIAHTPLRVLTALALAAAELDRPPTLGSKCHIDSGWLQRIPRHSRTRKARRYHRALCMARQPTRGRLAAQGLPCLAGTVYA